MRIRIKSQEVIIAALSAVVLIGGCHDEKKNPMMDMQRPPAAVTATAAVTRDVPMYLDQIGRTVAIDVVSIVPQVGGKIIATHVEDGAEVKKGDLLFEIDPRPFQAALASAEAMLAESKANLSWANTEYGRMKSLVETNAISTNEFEEKQNTLDVARAKLQASQAAVDTAKLNLEYTKILAPIDGRAGARKVVAGNIVKENDITLLVIQRLDPIYAEFTVTENDLGTVRKYIASRGLNMLSPEKGLKVEVDVPGNSRQVIAALGPVNKPTTAPVDPSAATASAVPSATQPTTQPASQVGPRLGELTFLDNAVQDGSGTVKVRARVPNADRYFWPGQFVNCRLILTVKKQAVLIPLQAQQIGQQGPFVYVVGADGKADLRPIQPGQRQGDQLVVESGVSAGEKVIVTGQMMVMPGAPVQIVSDPMAPTTAPAAADAHATAK